MQPSSGPTRIATYTRISTDEEHQPFSLEAQSEVSPPTSVARVAAGRPPLPLRPWPIRRHPGCHPSLRQLVRSRVYIRLPAIAAIGRRHSRTTQAFRDVAQAVSPDQDVATGLQLAWTPVTAHVKWPILLSSSRAPTGLPASTIHCSGCSQCHP